jgi:hypothetical protein
MRPTTLVTLKARSQAFRMAMGVLHEGKVSSVRHMRCLPVVIRCDWCGKEFANAPNMTSCPQCIAGMKRVVRTKPRVTFKRVVTLAIILMLCAVPVLILFWIGEENRSEVWHSSSPVNSAAK